MNAPLGLITRSERASSASVFIVWVRASKCSPRATLGACALTESLSRSPLSTPAPLLPRLHIFPNSVSGFSQYTYYCTSSPQISKTNVKHVRYQLCHFLSLAPFAVAVPTAGDIPRRIRSY